MEDGGWSDGFVVFVVVFLEDWMEAILLVVVVVRRVGTWDRYSLRWKAIQRDRKRERERLIVCWLGDGMIRLLSSKDREQRTGCAGRS